MKKSAWLSKVVCAALFVSVCSGAYAADGIWTNTVSGNWSDTANWTNGVVAGSGGSATFSLTTGTINVANDLGSVSLSNITVNADTGYTAAWNITGGTNSMVAPAIIDVVAGELSVASATLSSAVDIMLTGSGIFNLGQDNLLSGRTIIANGNVLVTDDSAFGSVPGALDADAVTLDGGGFLNSGIGTTLNLSVNRGVTVTAAGGYLGALSNNASIVINGPITGGGTLTQQGAGKLVLGGTVINTNLVMAVDAGTLELAKTGAAANYAVLDLAGVASGALAKLTGSNGNQIGGDLTLDGGTLDLNGHDERVAALSNTFNGGTVVNNGGSSATLTVGDGGVSSEFSGAIEDGTSTLDLVKIGTGTVSLAANSLTYTGGTQVDEGTLALRLVPPDVSATLAYRLDASNSDSLTLSGSNVTDWNDSSGAGVNFSQSNADQQPTYIPQSIGGRPAIRFGTGGSKRMYANKSADAHTVFIVNRKTAADRGLAGIWGQNEWDFGIRAEAANKWQAVGNESDFTNLGHMYINGVEGNSFVLNDPHILTADRGSVATHTHAIGDYWGHTGHLRYFQGEIGEVLVYSGTLSATERDAVVAYLHKKWFSGGSSAPVFSKLAYQLDASNADSLTLDGLNVTDWADSTGFGVDFSQSTAAQQPTYVTNSINGLPAIRFGAGGRKRMYASKSAGAQTVFIVNRMTAHVSLAGIWGENGNDFGIRSASISQWQHIGNSANFNNPGTLYINGVVGNNFTANQTHILTADRGSVDNGTHAIGDYWNYSTHLRYFKGEIGEILVYGALTPDERAEVDAYLQAKWMTSGGTPSGNPVDVAQGAQLLVENLDLGISELAGGGDLRSVGSVISLGDYSSFTGTVSGAGTVALNALDGADATFLPNSINVIVRNDGAQAATLIIDSTETNFFYGSLQDGDSTLALTHSGAGLTYFSGVASTYTGVTTIEAGVAAVKNRFYTKYIRFSPSAMRVGGSNYGSGYQISEFHIMLDGEKIEYPGGTLATSPGKLPGTEGPEKAIDGSVDTKFYTNINPAPPLIIELPEPLYLDGYRWYTANDSDGRDPIIWTVSISDDGESWMTISSQDYSANSSEITTDREVVAGTWIAGSEEMNVLSDLSATTLSSPAELQIVATSETVGSLSGDGDVTLADATLGINAFEDATFSGDISGSGSIVKKGAETQTLSGALAVTGDIVVEAGVLDLEGAVLTGITNIILKTGGVLTGSATVNGDLTVTFDGGTSSATLTISGTLTTAGTVNLDVPEGTTYPLNQLLFSYASADQATLDALNAATLPTPPSGHSANIHVTATSARLVVAPGGTLILIR